MDFDAFKEACFSEAAARGCGDAEIYYAQSTSSSVDVLEGAVESYEVNTDGGANLRVKYDGKSGYAFTQKLDEPDKLVIRAIDNAMAVETADEQPMQGKSEYRTISRPQKRADELTNDGRTELALELERTAKAADSRVVRVMTCTVAEQQTRIRISNTRGLDAADESRIAFAVLAPVTKVEDDVRTAYAFRTGDEIFDIDALAAGCRFADCAHLCEPGCAVREAVERGELDRKRYESYVKLKTEKERRVKRLEALARNKRNK